MKHAEQLAPLIDRSMTDAGIVRQDLTAIAVGVGPGPFTGLRVGLVTARTLGYVLEVPVVDKPAVLATDGPVVGLGAALYPEAFPRRVGPEAPSAGWLARAVAEERAELHDPEPLYLRRPDADTGHVPKRVS